MIHHVVGYAVENVRLNQPHNKRTESSCLQKYEDNLSIDSVFDGFVVPFSKHQMHIPPQLFISHRHVQKGAVRASFRSLRIKKCLERSVYFLQSNVRRQSAFKQQQINNSC